MPRVGLCVSPALAAGLAALVIQCVRIIIVRTLKDTKLGSQEKARGIKVRGRYLDQTKTQDS